MLLLVSPLICRASEPLKHGAWPDRPGCGKGHFPEAAPQLRSARPYATPATDPSTPLALRPASQGQHRRQTQPNKPDMLATREGREDDATATDKPRPILSQI